MKVQVSEKYYTIGGVVYPRVSEVLSIVPRPGLDRWRSLATEDQLCASERARDLGTEIHLVTELHDRKEIGKVDEMLTVRPDLVPFWVAWFDWTDRYVEEMMEIEVIVWSRKMGCAGKIDRVARMKGDRRPSIIDIKTGHLWDGMRLQLAMYKEMYNEGRREKAERRITVNLPWREPGKLRIKEYTGWEEDRKRVREIVKDYHKMRR